MNQTESTEKALSRAFSYEEYQEQMLKFVENEETSGEEQSEDLIKYTKLNQARMKRLNKKLQVEETVLETLNKLNNQYTWLVLTESWCGDAAHSIPVINKIAELSENISLKVAYRDENMELMNHFLINEAAAIPKLLILDDQNNILADWGPRPCLATKKVEKFKKENGKLTPEFKEQLQVWYNKNKGEDITNDLHVILMNIVMQNEKVILH